MAQLLEKLLERSITAEVAAIDVVDEIPEGLELIPGSDSPPALLGRTSDSRLRWPLSAPISRSITLTYQVRPLDTVTTPRIFYFSGGLTAITDTEGLTKTAPIHTGALTVTGPCDTPTPPPSPTPTLTPSTPPTAITSATPTTAPSATATPTRAPLPVYLPLALKEHCDPWQIHVDVALVIDASSSMGQITAAGDTKLDAARSAVRSFLDRLDPATDRAAVVAFNSDAQILQGLTGDRTALDGALDDIQLRQYTCLVCAVEEGWQALAGGRRGEGAARVMIVLTDGMSNPRPASEAVEVARQAKTDAVIVITVGLGEVLDVNALREMASSDEYFYRAPNAEDLASIYEGLAAVIPCPAEGFWGHR